MIWRTFLELDVKEIKMSSILLSKLSGLVETSWPVNLNNDTSLETNVWFTTEYFSLSSLAYYLEIGSFNKD